MFDHRARFSPISPAPYRGGGEFRGFGKPENPVFGDFGEFRDKYIGISTYPACGDAQALFGGAVIFPRICGMVVRCGAILCTYRASTIELAGAVQNGLEKR